MTFPILFAQGVGDKTPSAFNFTACTGQNPSTTVVSNYYTPVCYDTPAPISISGGSYCVSGIGFTTSAGTIRPGCTVSVCMTSPSYSSACCAVLTIGSPAITAGFCVTTRALDATPDAFTFTSYSNVNTSSICCNTVTITGIDCATVNASGSATMSVNGGGFGTGPCCICNNQTLCMKNTGSASYSTTCTGYVCVGTCTATSTIASCAAPPVAPLAAYTTDCCILVIDYDTSAISCTWGPYTGGLGDVNRLTKGINNCACQAIRVSRNSYGCAYDGINASFNMCFFNIVKTGPNAWTCTATTCCVQGTNDPTNLSWLYGHGCQINNLQHPQTAGTGGGSPAANPGWLWECGQSADASFWLVKDNDMTCTPFLCNKCRWCEVLVASGYCAPTQYGQGAAGSNVVSDGACYYKVLPVLQCVSGCWGCYVLLKSATGFGWTITSILGTRWQMHCYYGSPAECAITGGRSLRILGTCMLLGGGGDDCQCGDINCCQARMWWIKDYQSATPCGLGFCCGSYGCAQCYFEQSSKGHYCYFGGTINACGYKILMFKEFNSTTRCMSFTETCDLCYGWAYTGQAMQNGNIAYDSSRCGGKMIGSPTGVVCCSPLVSQLYCDCAQIHAAM